jgi:hypothetical protein
LEQHPHWQAEDNSVVHSFIATLLLPEVNGCSCCYVACESHLGLGLDKCDAATGHV